MMREVWIVTNERQRFTTLARNLSAESWSHVNWAKSGEGAFDAASLSQTDLVVIDDRVDDGSGVEVARAIVWENAFVNLAVASDMPEKEFHQLSEGLGILMHLPLTPDQGNARALMSAVEQIQA